MAILYSPVTSILERLREDRRTSNLRLRLGNTARLCLKTTTKAVGGGEEWVQGLRTQ